MKLKSNTNCKNEKKKSSEDIIESKASKKSVKREMHLSRIDHTHTVAVSGANLSAQLWCSGLREPSKGHVSGAKSKPSVPSDAQLTAVINKKPESPTSKQSVEVFF